MKERLQKKLQTQMDSKLKEVKESADGGLGVETQELIAQNKRQVEEMQRMLLGGNK